MSWWLPSPGPGARRRQRSATMWCSWERYLPCSRHVEVQVFGDGWTPTSTCSTESFDPTAASEDHRRSTVPRTTDATRTRMYAAALSLAERIGYVGAGTVEFLVSGDGDAQEFFFLEMNTRLQVEHRVTERSPGQPGPLAVARRTRQGTAHRAGRSRDGRTLHRGPALRGGPPTTSLPSVGRLRYFGMPSEFSALVDSGYATGDEVSRYYDPMLAKIITHGDSRRTTADMIVDAARRCQPTGSPRTATCCWPC